MMKHTLGDDWESLFELNIVNCKKPLFQRGEAPLLTEENDKITSAD